MSTVFSRRYVVAWIAATIASIVAGCLTLYLVQNGFGGSLVLLVSGGDYANVSGGAIVLAVIAAALLGTFVFQFATNRFRMAILRVYEVIYLLAVLWIAFFKSPGISGVNLNPLDIVSQVRQDPAALAANLLLFAPLGFILKAYGLRISHVITMSFLTSLAIEIIQVVFALGIFDVVDLIANTLGAILGGLLCEELSGCFRVTYVNDGVMAFQRRQTHGKISRYVCVGAVLLVTTAVALIAALSPHGATVESVSQEFVPTGSIAILANSDNNAVQAVADQLPSADMTVGEDGCVTIQGRCDMGASWVDSGGSRCIGISVALNEAVYGDGVVLPVVLRADAEMAVGGERATIDEVANALLGSVARRVTLSGTLEDGWLRADSIELGDGILGSLSTESSAVETIQESFPWSSYGNLESVIGSGDYRDLGYVSSFTQTQGKSFVTVCNIGSYRRVPIIFVVNYQVGDDWSPGTIDLGSPDNLVDVSSSSLESLLYDR